MSIQFELSYSKSHIYSIASTREAWPHASVTIMRITIVMAARSIQEFDLKYRSNRGHGVSIGELYKKTAGAKGF